VAEAAVADPERIDAKPVNQDTAGAPQNETSIAVDPNRPSRVVASANDYVSRTWSCTIGGTPCSALGDAYSGTYYSNDGGATWCCASSDPNHLGTLIPGVTRLTGGQYDAGGDPAVAFDSHGNVFYAGLGFNRTSAPNTVAVNKGTFSAGGALSWGPPVFINQTTAPSTLNDKEWIAVDSHASSAFRDNVYVTWTRFLFNAHNGAYTQSPIFFASSSDGGAPFSTPKAISGSAHCERSNSTRRLREAKLALAWTPGSFASAASITCSKRGETMPSTPSTTCPRCWRCSCLQRPPARSISASSALRGISRGS